MNRNMYEWLDGVIKNPVKKAMPILSFPSIQLMNITVNELISSPETQSEGMCLVADKTDALASVSFMDLSVEAEAFGSTVKFSDDEVPTVTGRIVSGFEDAAALKVPNVGDKRTGSYIEAIRLACLKIKDRPVFAGAIGPYSLAGRLVDVSESMIMCYEEPETMHEVLGKVTEFLIGYISAFKKAGANGIVIAEPLAGMLSPALCHEFSEPYVKKIVDAVQDESFIVIYHNCGNSVIQMVDHILACGAKAYHFGNAIDISKILPLIPSDVGVMGNIDPAGELKNGTPESVHKKTLELLSSCSGYPNYIISSGCDIPPLANWENIDTFLSTVNDFYTHLKK